MGQRGRKSTAELSISGPNRRLSPNAPRELSNEACNYSDLFPGGLRCGPRMFASFCSRLKKNTRALLKHHATHMLRPSSKPPKYRCPLCSMSCRRPLGSVYKPMFTAFFN
jgi:hypothetical protein